MRFLGWILAACLGLAPIARAEAVRPLPVKVVVLTTFEIGADTGDQPGEFQLWVEGLPLTETLDVTGLRHPARMSVTTPSTPKAWPL